MNGFTLLGWDGGVGGGEAIEERRLLSEDEWEMLRSVPRTRRGRGEWHANGGEVLMKGGKVKGKCTRTERKRE